MKRNSALTAVFLTGCALGTWSWYEAVQPERQDGETKTAEVSGYYLLNAGFVSPGPDGQPLYRLDASRMTLGVASGLVEMDRVRIEYRQESTVDWVVTAPSGSARLDWKTLQLQGGVRVVVESAEGPTVFLDTPVLRVDANESLASTESEVQLARGPHTVEAVGMTVDLTAGLVRLESRVNGLFKP